MTTVPKVLGEDYELPAGRKSVLDQEIVLRKEKSYGIV